jgi:hypothetical protein
VTPRGPAPRLPLFGLFLIAFRLLFLLQNLGFLSWSLWPALWRYWPVLLIIFGTNLVLGRQAPLLAMSVILLLLAGVVVLAVTGAVGAPAVSGEHTERLSEPLAGAQELEVRLDFGAGRLRIEALPPGSGRLWEGLFLLPGGVNVTPTLSRTGEKAVLNLGLGTQGGPFILPWGGPHEWTLRLPPEVALAIDMDGGAADMDLDLTGLRLSRLTLDIGAANMDLTLPSTPGTATVEINGGAADLDIRIPTEVAARIRTEGGLTDFDTSSRFQPSGDYRVSSGYETAERRIELTVKAGAAHVSVQ